MAPQNRDGGFSMIELLVTIALLVVMMTIAISGWVVLQAGWHKRVERAVERRVGHRPDAVGDHRRHLT